MGRGFLFLRHSYMVAASGAVGSEVSFRTLRELAAAGRQLLSTLFFSDRKKPAF